MKGSTGIGFGIAIPLGKSASSLVSKEAFAKKERGIDWNCLDGEPAKLIFMIAVPEESAGNEHFKRLQLLSRKLMNDEFSQNLLKVQSKEEVLKLL